MINEIEVVGTTLAVDCYRITDTAAGIKSHLEAGVKFSCSPGTEADGFHDLDFDGDQLRGFYSVIEAFEVEHLADGFTTKSLLKRVRSCEFWTDGKVLLVWGSTGPSKALRQVIAGVSTPLVAVLSPRLLSEKASLCKEVGLQFPKDRDVRRAKLTGTLDDDDIDQAAHVASCKGLLDTPQGPLTVTARENGRLTLQVRRGFGVDVGCILWILELASAEPAEAGAKEGDDNPVRKACKKLMASVPGGVTMTISCPQTGKSATIGRCAP